MQVLLSVTLSGTALALLLLLLRYVIFRRMPSSVYYYAWLLVLLRFALPLPGFVPVGNTESAPAAAIYAPAPVEYDAPRYELPRAAGDAGVKTVTSPLSTPKSQNTAPAAKTSAKNYVNLKSPRLWLGVWGVGAAVSLAFYVLSYELFSLRIRRSLSLPTLEDRRVYRMLPGRKPRLMRCAACDTPLMFGVFRPLITLPERVYSEELLTNILRHELLHYRRRDPLYKWLAVAVLSTQWFNPLSYLIRQELNRACELSCDEMLLKDMDRAGKQSYGNTLLSMAASGALPAGVVATTFSTEKRNLKERLEQIMYYKRSMKRVFAAVLALVLLVGGAVLAGPLPRAAADAEAGDVVKVSTVDGLLAALAPDTVIELAPGTYDLSKAADYGQDTHSSYYSWNGVYDGFELTLHNMENVTIRGAGKGETVLAAVPRYANVLKLSGCRDVRIEALTAGHTTEPGFCMGGVLSFEGCERVTADACGLYGCGTIGVQARECHELTVKGSEIYECSYGAVSVGSCRDVTVEDCDIHDHGTRAGQGDAIFVFDLNYSDGVTIHQNRIHDNHAQVMLNSDYARRVLFLTNELRGNAFVTNIFDLEGYGITVDGCVFEGNDVRGGWYSGSGVYASSVSGETLEAALFGEMTLRDIDPDDVLPPVPPSGALDLPKGGEVTVTTVDEFLEALGPDRTIILDGALFDLSTAANYGGIGTDCYYWAENYDGPELVIHDLDGLTIYAKNTASGATTLAAIPRYANVLSFRNCENLTLGGFTAGHTKEPGSCSGGVLSFQSCHQVTIEKMRLYGCGILGIQASQSTSFNILRTEIYECSQGGAVFFQCDGLRFEDCSIHDVPSPALRFNQSGDKTWNGEAIDGLDGEYDVDESGALAACAPPEAVGYALADAQAEYDFVRAMQETIVNGDWENLAANSAYPLKVIFPGERDRAFAHIPDAESLLALDLDKILDEDYRRYVLNAGMGDFYLTIWGYKALDDALCFNTYPEGEPKVSALLLTASRVAGDQRGLETLTPYLTSPGVPENPYDYEQPIPFAEGSPQLTFAREVQRLFTNHDWVKLSAKISYPLQVFSANTSYMINNPTDFLAMVHELLFTPEFYRLIENAELDSYGHSSFGNTFCAHRLAMACVSDTLSSADDLKLTCISVDGPLYQFKEGLSVPPTPMPSLRVMFYESEIRDEFTIYPGDPVELHVRLQPEIGPGTEVEWTSDHPSVLAVEKTGADTALVSCVDDGSLPQTCRLTVRCGDMAREITVYCRK